MISRRFRGAAVSFSPREGGGMLIRRAENAENSPIGGIARRGLAPSARRLREKREWTAETFLVLPMGGSRGTIINPIKGSVHEESFCSGIQQNQRMAASHYAAANCHSLIALAIWKLCSVRCGPITM